MAKETAAAPWERQEGESPEAYSAFSLYLHMGDERSTAKVGQKLGKSKKLIDRWSSRWGWVERIRSWDNDLAQKAKKRAEKDIEEMFKRHIAISMGLQSKAMHALTKMPSESMSAQGVAALVKLGVDIERLSRGEPTERTEGKNEVTGEIKIDSPLDGFTREELRTLLDVARSAANEDD